jgi:hypothetical protein
VFNDGAFEAVTAKEARSEMLIELHDGEPIRFGADGERGVILNEFAECEIVEVADVGVDKLLVHDEKRESPALAFALALAWYFTELPWIRLAACCLTVLNMVSGELVIGRWRHQRDKAIAAIEAPGAK